MEQLVEKEEKVNKDKTRTKKFLPRGGISIIHNSVMENAAIAAKKTLGKHGVAIDEERDFQALDCKQFPCGEIKPRITMNVRAKDVFLFFGFSNGNFNDDLIKLVLTLNALDKADCKRVTLVLPFFPYTRQDRKDEARTPLSAAVIVRMLELSSSLERIITMDMHSEQIELVFGSRIKVDHLPGSILMSRWVEKNLKKKLSDVVVVAPDNGSAKRAHKLAKRIGVGEEIAIFDKQRDAEGISIGSIIGADVAGKICLVNDDMIDTGGTIAEAAKTLLNKGAREVILSCTHPIFSPKGDDTAYGKLAESGAKVIVTDSLVTEKFPWLEVLPIGKLMGEVILQNITPDGSVSKIIDGEE